MKLQILKVLFILLFIGFDCIAQQEVQNTFFQFNSVFINPAYSGSREALSAVLNTRTQWVNWNGAPKTHIFTMHTPLKNELIGAGLNFVSDIIGPTERNSIYGNISYKIRVNKNAKLSFGMHGGVDLLRNNFSNLTIIDETDPLHSSNYFNRNIFNFGASIYYYSKSFYTALSCPRLIENNLSTNNSFISKQVKHYYFLLGYVYERGLWAFKPAIQVKGAYNAPVSVDINLSVYFNRKISMSLFYRNKADIGTNMVFHFNEQLYAGYAYDFSVSNMTKFNAGSHEIMLGFDLNRKGKGFLTPRYF